MSEKLFGTDGIRGVANVYPLTVDFCMKLAVILSSFACNKHKKVAIARDSRISGSMIFSALSAGFNSQGVDVIYMGVIPTPLCTTLTPNLGVDMSIMITASHNPYKDNGLKLINSDGDKFSDDMTEKLEKLMAEPFEPKYNPEKVGTAAFLECGIDDYLSTAKKIAPQNCLKNLKVVLDSANGSFSGIMTAVFQYLGAQIISLADYPDGYNINENCGSQHTELLCKTVVNKGYDLGIAVDGDGDRIIICDEKGSRLDGDQIIAYLASYMQKHNLLSSDIVVSTVSSNLGLGKYLSSIGLKHVASAVGERYVIEKMREMKSNLGGEESGHIVLSDYTKTGDALLTAIVICMGIYESKRKVSEIFPVFEPFPCESQNLRFENKEIIEKIMNSDLLNEKISEITTALAGHGRILVRKSGTEPLIRLKIEDETADLANKQMQQLLECINKIKEGLESD